MEKKVFNMCQCNKGDFLVTSGGYKLKYISNCGECEYPHVVLYLGDSDFVIGIGNRTDKGWTFMDYDELDDGDVVGFWEE